MKLSRRDVTASDWKTIPLELAMKTPRNLLIQMFELILLGGAVKATKYLSETQIVRAVRRTYGGKIVKGNTEVLFTIGNPNYAEREFIKACKKAGEPFPVKKVQIKLAKKKGGK